MDDSSFPPKLAIQVLTIDQFRTISKEENKVLRSFDLAIENLPKSATSSQFYSMSEFIDDYNNQNFRGETDKYWITYIFVEK